MRVLLAALILLSSGAAKAVDFSGFRPRQLPNRSFSFHFGIFPYSGFRDLQSFGKIPKFIDILNNFDYPSASLSGMSTLLTNVNKLYNESFSLHSVILPQLHLFWANDIFELSISGGGVNVTRSEVFRLGAPITSLDIQYDPWHGYYAITDEQKLFRVRSRSLAGIEAWGLFKIPLRQHLRLLVGFGGDLAYYHDYDYVTTLAKNITSYTAFTNSSDESEGVRGNFGLRLGLAYTGGKYLQGRAILEANGLASWRKLPQLNLDMNVKLWKIGVFSSSVRDMTSLHPEVRLEWARKIHPNHEIGLGGVLHSRIFNSNFGYFTFSIGGKYLKFTGTLIFDRSQVGVLTGVGIGYWP